jgi:hypothetical protein
VWCGVVRCDVDVEFDGVVASRLVGNGGLVPLSRDLIFVFSFFFFFLLPFNVVFVVLSLVTAVEGETGVRHRCKTQAQDTGIETGRPR